MKTAIGTRLMTGTVAGTGCMIASSAPAPASLGRFEWVTDSGRSVFRLEKFLQTAAAMMARRHEDVSVAYSARLSQLHDDEMERVG